MSSKSNRGASRSIIGPDIHGETLFSESQYVANAYEVGSMGRGLATSGLTASTSYIELTAGLSLRAVLAVANEGSVKVYVGPSGNGTANMYPVPTGSQISFNVTSGVTMYALTASSTANVRVMEIG